MEQMEKTERRGKDVWEQSATEENSSIVIKRSKKEEACKTR